MLIDPYVTEKLRELDADLARHSPPSAGRSPTFALSPVARVAGRALRRVGERLESWSTSATPESNGARPAAASQTTRSAFKPREEGC